MDSLKKSIKTLIKTTKKIAILDYLAGDGPGQLEIVISFRVEEDQIKDTIFEKRMLSCRKCDYLGKDKDELKKHLHSHPNEIVRKAFQCSQCECFFNTKHILKSHIDHFHDNVKRFKCPCCPYKSYYRYDVIRHIKRIHPESDLSPISIMDDEDAPDLPKEQGNLRKMTKRTKPSGRPSGLSSEKFMPTEIFICHLCAWTFNQKYIFEKHISEVHMGIKRFECPSSACGYKSSIRSHVLKHIKTQHPDLDAVPINIEQIKHDPQNKEENLDDEILAILNEAEEKFQQNGDLSHEKATKKTKKLEKRIKRKWAEAGLDSKSKWKEAKRVAIDLAEAARYKENEDNLKTLWKDYKRKLLESESENLLLSGMEVKEEPNFEEL